jgi:hypothetical protein
MDSCGIFPLLLHEPKEPCKKISLETQSSKSPIISLQFKGGLNQCPEWGHHCFVQVKDNHIGITAMRANICREQR